MEQNNFIISKMTILDLEKIKDSLENEFDDFWNYQIFKSELENPNSIYFIIKTDNEICGFVGMIKVLDIADIMNIVIKKDFRGKGLSKLLIEYIINYCMENDIKTINLEVSSKNIVAINLYKKYGFEEVGRRKKYYKDVDGILFTKHIESDI